MLDHFHGFGEVQTWLFQHLCGMKTLYFVDQAYPGILENQLFQNSSLLSCALGNILSHACFCMHGQSFICIMYMVGDQVEKTMI